MTMSKEGIEKRVRRVQRDYQRVLEQQRVKWLQNVCKEAIDTYNFGSLGELIIDMVNNAAKIQPKNRY